MSAGRDIMIETASTINEKAQNYRSASGKYRCSLFAAAFIEELTTYPKGRISQHYAGIKEELQFVAPDQETSTPLAICSSQNLFSHNISHFVLSPTIANAISNVASGQVRHEDLLRSRANVRDFWTRVRRQNSAMPGNSSNAHSDSSDMKILIIQQYLEELGSSASEQNRCTLATACQLVLDGKVGDDLKDRVTKTIAWQEAQLLRVDHLLTQLVDQDLIARFVEEETAREYQDEFIHTLPDEFHQIPAIEELYGPPHADGYVDVFFEDAGEWLIGALALNRTLCPSAFNIDQVVDGIIGFLQENPVDLMLG